MSRRDIRPQPPPSDRGQRRRPSSAISDPSIQALGDLQAQQSRLPNSASSQPTINAFGCPQGPLPGRLGSPRYRSHSMANAPHRPELETQHGRRSDSQPDQGATHQPGQETARQPARGAGGQSGGAARSEKSRDEYRHWLLKEIRSAEQNIPDAQRTLFTLQRAYYRGSVNDELKRRATFLANDKRERIERLKAEFRNSYHPAVRDTCPNIYAYEIRHELQHESDPRKRLEKFKRDRQRLKSLPSLHKNAVDLLCQYQQIIDEEKRIIGGIAHLEGRADQASSGGASAAAAASHEADAGRADAGAVRASMARASTSVARTPRASAREAATAGTGAEAAVPSSSRSIQGRINPAWCP